MQARGQIDLWKAGQSRVRRGVSDIESVAATFIRDDRPESYISMAFHVGERDATCGVVVTKMVNVANSVGF